MTAPDPAPVLAPGELAREMGDPRLRLVDLRAPERYAESHLPGAVSLAYADIVAQRPPVGGLLPTPQELARILGALGIGDGHRVVAYDDEGSGRAARLLWTLHAVGHRDAAVLDGGFPAWAAAGLALEHTPVQPSPATFTVREDPGVVADFDYIHARLGDPATALLDARSAEEYSGELRRADLGGHVPGAVHLEWTELMDPDRHRRLKPAAQIEAMLRERGIAPQQEVIVYCHTHHRSALSYLALKALGYERVRGYPGSWSDWGNRAGAPAES